MCVTMLRNGGIIVTVIIIIIIIIRQTSAGARVLEQGGPWAVLGGTWRARGARAYNGGLLNSVLLSPIVSGGVRPKPLRTNTPRS